MGYYYLTFGNVIFDLLLIKVVRHPYPDEILFYLGMPSPNYITDTIDSKRIC